MVKVKSLSLRIVLQFGIILLPLVAMLVYETGTETRRVSDLSRAFSLNQIIEAKQQYDVFLDGAADAVDWGRLPARSLSALARSADKMAALAQSEAANAEALQAVNRDIRKILEALNRDTTVANLIQLREPITRVRTHLERAASDQRQRLDRAIEFAIRDAERTRELVFVVSGLMLAMTLGFIIKMIQGLSRPLGLAVDVADRIAAGQKLDSFEVDPRQDLGNLLSSLQRMHASLRASEEEVSRHRAELERRVQQLADSEQSLAQAQRTARLGSWQWLAGSARAYWSDEMYRILGLPAGETEPTLKSFLRAMPRGERSTIASYLGSVLDGSTGLCIEHGVATVHGDSLVVHHQITAERDPQGQLLRVYGTLQDITDRRRTEEKIRHMAMYDSLTGLANRHFFNENLRNAVAQAKRRGSGVATLFIDLDRFKRINDTLGHSIGDALLSEAAQRLVESIRETDSVGVAQANSEDMVARLGGDEFTVLLRDVLDPRDAAVVATRMLKALARPFIIEMHELVVTASIGIAMYPVDGDDGDALMKAADAGMYQAKNLGRNNAQFYSAELNTSAFEKLSLENELHLAVKTPPWVLHYQPKVDITTGSIAGVEALIRWKHPKWGVVPPSRFIPVAEEIGLISAIGDWVLEEACRQAAEWKQAGLGEINIAVNLASPSFRKATLVSGLAKLINQYSIRPAQLQIEATESMLMEHAGLTINTLKELNKLGVKLSIDDFGTGYSSLSYLRRFPVDQLKIDRSFVTEMTNNADDAAITAAIISLGRDMKREIVAEGVETMAQARLLRQQGCKLVQGYLFSHAIPAAEMSEMLRFDRPFAAVIADLGLALAVGHS